MPSTCCSRGKARRLLVAGVDPSVTKPDLARSIPGSAKWLACCVDLGSESVDTRSNAEEAARWLAKHNYQLAAADHQRLAHAPRALRISAGCCSGKYKLMPDAVRTEPSFLTLFGEYNKYLLRRARGLGRPLMALLRSLLYAAIFYPLTVVWVLARHCRELVRARPTLAVVLSWADLHHWLVRACPRHSACGSKAPSRPGPHLIAVKHQSMLETLEMVRLGQSAGDRDQEGARRHPALRLADPPLWRHRGRALRRREGAARAWSRKANERSQPAAR